MSQLQAHLFVPTAELWELRISAHFGPEKALYRLLTGTSEPVLHAPRDLPEWAPEAAPQLQECWAAAPGGSATWLLAEEWESIANALPEGTVQPAALTLLSQLQECNEALPANEEARLVCWFTG